MKTRLFKGAFTALALALAILVGSAVPQNVYAKNNSSVSNSGMEVVTVSKSESKALSDSTSGYAHDITINTDGTFNFQYDGETYESEFERLMAEDGFMYGVNWDWFGTWQQQITNLGDSEITGYKSYFRAEYFKRAMYNLKALGFNTLANWVGPDGTYTYDEAGLITGLNETFVTNLTALLDACRETGMDFVPGLLTHNYGTINDERVINGLTANERYHKYFRFYYDDEALEAYINNGINKVLDIMKDYQDVIPVIALTIENGSRTNDVENGMYYNVIGPTWEGMATLMNAMHDAVKAKMPNVLTSVEDIGGWPGNIAKYNDLKVDIEGFNYYTTDNFPDISSLMLTRPTYLGEFDVYHDSASYTTATQEFLDNIRSTYYSKAVKGGYMGAFYYPFCYNDISAKSTFFSGSSVDRYDQLRGWVIEAAYSITDLKHEYRGTSGMDVPALFYNNGTKDIYFMGGRNIDHYVLERRENGGSWKVISNKITAADNMINNGLIYYKDETLKENVTYEYRVTAVNVDGKKATSKVGNAFKLFVPEESFVDGDGNYAGGFEQGTLNGTKSAWPSNGWYKEESWMKELAQFTKGDARTGDYYLKVDVANGIGISGNYNARWAYNLVLKPNTLYTLSFWSRNSNGMFGITAQDNAGNQLKWTYPAGDSEMTGEWIQREVTFTSPEDGKVKIRLSNIVKEDMVVNLDDISIKEAR